ncbi:acyltransferase family protein [Neisseria musculi]|uniref:Acyltransferase family protein n=1 Tax=Neisseria musculi TaxID=1815583 RepID=A0A7H1MB97_9NEIS|nr:acyltransferase family protein [Neisseria musculi]QNT58912.1 acyltransferase family protein [Neisseria musculi]
MSKVFAYRPDIDVLRAVAVLSVIIFHFEKSWLPGGFLGVDIFFVISGFLITSIIHKEMNTGAFSFKSFYIRRIKRILPAFFTVLAGTLAVGALLFAPDDFNLLGKSALASVLFAANLYFSRGQGYFDPAQEEKPLLHIWSLSVEEQYYFIFPFFLLLFIRRSLKTQMAAIAACMLVSLLAAYIPTQLDKYYLPHLRAFEMLTGSLLAVFVCHQAANSQEAVWWGEKFAAFGCAAASVVLAACLAAYHTETAHFPGWAGLIPCLAAAALIYFNGFNHSLKKIFEWEWGVRIGLISYSLYLWHWPVLAFARYIYGQAHLPAAWLLPLAVLILICSWAAYRWVEQPAKKWKLSFAKSLTAFYILPAALLAAAWFGLQKTPLISQYQKDGLSRSYASCHNNLEKQCVWGANDTKPTVLMLGDSHADHYKTFIDHIGKKEGWAATLVSADTCAFVEGYDAEIFKGSNCKAVYQYAKAHLNDYPVVMLSMRWGNQLPAPKPSIGYDKDFFAKMDKMLAKLSKEKRAVYLFTDNPNIQYPGLRAYKISGLIPLRRIAFHENDSSTREGNRKISETAAKYRNIHIVDAAALLPADFEFDGKPAYSDLDHINPFGAEALAKRYTESRHLLQRD